MAYTRRNYTPFRYTPQSYQPQGSTLPYNQNEFDPYDYEKLFQSTVPPPTPAPEEPPFDFPAEYEKAVGKRPARLAYQQAVEQGPQYINRGKWAKLAAGLAAGGSALGGSSAEQAARLGTSVYQAPNERRKEQWKDRVSGLAQSAQFEQSDISERIRMLESNRRDYYDRLQEKRAASAEGRAVSSEERDKEADRLENERRRALLEEAKWEYRTDEHTGIKYKRRKGTTEWIADSKPQLSKVEDIMYGAMEAGEKKKAEEAALQPGRIELAGKRTEGQLSVQELRGSQTLRAKLLKEANAPNATEQYKQRRMNFITALDRDPSLQKYIKYDDAGEPQIKSIQEVTWGEPEPEDVLGIEKLRAAVMAGAPLKEGGNTSDIQAAELKYKDEPRNAHDKSITMTSPKGKKENKSIQSVDYWRSQGYKLPSETGGTPTSTTTPTASPTQVDVNTLPKTPQGKVTMIDPDGNEFDADPKDVQHYLNLDPKVKVKRDEEETSGPSVATPPVPETPIAAPPTVPTLGTPNTVASTPGAPGIMNRGGAANAFARSAPLTIPSPTRPQVVPLNANNAEATDIFRRSLNTQPPPPPSPIPRVPSNLAPNANPMGFNNAIPMAPPPSQPMGLPANNMFSMEEEMPGPIAPNRPPVTPPRAPIGLPAENMLMNMPEEPIAAPSPGRVPMAPPPNPIRLQPDASLTNVPNVQFGQPPQSQLGRAPFGRASALTSELTNPISLRATLGRPGPVNPPESIKREEPTKKEETGESEFIRRLGVVGERFKKATGYELKTISSRRTPEQQANLYAQGRSAGDKRPIITQADGTKVLSKHQSGEAVDLGFINDQGKTIKVTDSKGRPTKEGTRLYNTLGKLAKEQGLVWGGDWKDPYDPGHLQLGEVLQKGR